MQESGVFIVRIKVVGPNDARSICSVFQLLEVLRTRASSYSAGRIFILLHLNLLEVPHDYLPIQSTYTIAETVWLKHKFLFLELPFPVTWPLS